MVAFFVNGASTEHSMDEFFICIGHCCLLLTYCTNLLSSTFPLGCGFQNIVESGVINSFSPQPAVLGCYTKATSACILKLEGTIIII